MNNIKIITNDLGEFIMVNDDNQTECGCFEEEYEEVVLSKEKVENIVYMFEKILSILYVNIELGSIKTVQLLKKLEGNMKNIVEDLS
jgi:hypothetical protein